MGGEVSETETRMAKRANSKETVEQYEIRLRRTALAIPEEVVRKTLLAIPGRARAAVKEDGGHISMD